MQNIVDKDMSVLSSDDEHMHTHPLRSRNECFQQDGREKIGLISTGTKAERHLWTQMPSHC